MAAEEFNADVVSSERSSRVHWQRISIHESRNYMRCGWTSNKTAAMCTEIEHMNADIQDMKGGLLTWSDEVVSLQSMVTSLQKQVVTLKDQCEDMEGRMRRGNTRITDINERPDSSSLTAVSKVIREALKMDRDIKIEFRIRMRARSFLTL